MNLRAIKKNMTEVTLSDGTKILFSYETPVVYMSPKTGWRVTDTFYSQTTTRHIGQYLGEALIYAKTVPQSEIDAIAGSVRV